MEDGPQEPAIDFIPAICFVKRGVAKERPDKVVLTTEELARVINDTRSELHSEDENDGTQGNEVVDPERQGNIIDYFQEESAEIATVRSSAAANGNGPPDEFLLLHYDREESGQVASIANIAIVDESAPADDDENDSEAEDEIIKPTDNLLLVGHVSDDSASMEVWVFNEEEESLYTHHDFILPSLPLCIEWLNHDPGSNKDGNMCAIGSMDPIITIWDLDIQDSFEPTFLLGSKGSRKRNKPKFGHKDAVLDLSWNSYFTHILSSGSVDETVILWDLDEGRPHTTVSVFTEKVQSVEFHPAEARILLTGCADGIVRLFDCRILQNISNNFKKWEMNGEVEKVIWDVNNSHFFMSGLNDGRLVYVDIRNNEPLWSIKAHENEISDICFNSQINNLLTTSSADGLFKVWKFNDRELKEVYQHDFALGRIQCMKQCPEDPFTLAFGGEKAPRFRVYNIKNFGAVRAAFNINEPEGGVEGREVNRIEQQNME